MFSILAGKTPLIMASIRNFSLLNTLVSGGEEAVVDDDDNVDNSESERICLGMVSFTLSLS